MEYKVLYRKYRPKSFDELVGQNAIKELLLNSIKNNKLSHAYLFTGPRGTGKTSSAKIFAKTINCENSQNGIPCESCPSCLSYNESPDIIEIDAASNNGVDEIRELRDNVKILPSNSKYKVYIIDEVHMLSSSAWNAFLKTLEEPPHHVIFILATTEIQKVPITVLSRCQRFDFQKIDNIVIEQRIEYIANKENVNITPAAIVEIAKLSDGAMRDALSFLDQLSKLDNQIDIETITKVYGVLTQQKIEDLLTNLDNGKIVRFIEIIDEIMTNGVDATNLLSKLLETLLSEAIIIKKSNQKKYINITNLENLIVELEQCYNRSNQYILIKAILLKHVKMDLIETQVPITEEIPSTDELPSIEKVIHLDNRLQPTLNEDQHPPEIISQEIISEEIQSKVNQDLINIRINNAYVNANINLKKEFIKTWEMFIQKLISNNDLKYLSLVKDTKVEVVSPTNCILSTEFYSNSVLFNSNKSEIEELLAKEQGITIKLICLDTETWNQEKTEYLKNRLTKEYELILEPDITSESEIIHSAEDIFGNELVEIN